MGELQKMRINKTIVRLILDILILLMMIYAVFNGIIVINIEDCVYSIIFVLLVLDILLELKDI